MPNLTESLVIQPCPAAERQAALAMLFPEVAVKELPGDEADRGLLAARRGERLVGCTWVRFLPGSSAVLWPPTTIQQEPATTRRALLEAGIQCGREADARLLQTALDPAERDRLAEFTAAGFRHLTDLVYLSAASTVAPQKPPYLSLQAEVVPTEEFQRLASVVERTYEGTLDCPQLNGVRDAKEVLADYQVCGEPSCWLLLRHAGQEVGCLLLNDHSADSQWELVYLGLVPEARGNGWGKQIARHAQWLTREAGRRRLVLSVDQANTPARNIYRRCGFTEWNRRTVLLRWL